MVRQGIEGVFIGQYVYCAPYSPALKPILSKGIYEIQDHLYASTPALTQINDAFYYYSDRHGQHGREAAV